MIDADDNVAIADAGSGDKILRCPKCGREVKSLQCGHCGSRLPDWQADLYGATIRQLAKLGGSRADDGSQGGEHESAPGDSQGDGDPPKDNGDASTPDWLFDGCNELAIQACGEPMALSVTLPDRDEQPSCGNVSTPEIVPKPKDDSLQNTETPPSLCRWIHDRLADAGLRPDTIFDPCAGNGNLTRPFRPHSEVIEYEIRTGNDFFDAQQVTCDLVLCNPPWSSAELFLRHIVRVVGSHTPIVLICPAVFLSGYKDGPVRQYLESPDAPSLHHCTLLPSDTFVKVYSPGTILWFNLPDVREVALVPSRFLIRSNSMVECPDVQSPVTPSPSNDERQEPVWPAASKSFGLEEVETWRRRKLTVVEEAMRRFFEDKSWLVGGPIPLCLLYDPRNVALLSDETTNASHQDAVFDHDGTDLEQLTDEMKRRGIDERYHRGLHLLHQRLCLGKVA